jgi:hypothetical protein
MVAVAAECVIGDFLVWVWNVVLRIVCLHGGGYMLTLHLVSPEALRGDILVMGGILIAGGYTSASKTVCACAVDFPGPRGSDAPWLI